MNMRLYNERKTYHTLLTNRNAYNNGGKCHTLQTDPKSNRKIEALTY